MLIEFYRKANGAILTQGPVARSFDSLQHATLAS